MTTVPTADIRLLLDLEPVVEAGLNRHLATAKEWFPHEYVPWSRGRDFDGVLGGQAWDPGPSELPEAVRTSLIVNLLTEDNLPSYHRVIAEHFGRDGEWGTWVHRWTAEEDRHGHVIRDYLLASRAVDPVALERARMVHMATGFELEYTGAAEAIAYVSFQELATRVAHRNTGRLSGDPVCDQLLARVAQDENLHMLFYRDLLDATFDLAPDAAMRAVTTVVTSFRMPGHGIDNFARKSAQIAVAGIYDLRLHHDEVVMPVLRRLRVFERCGLGPDGERARDALSGHLARLDRTANRFTERREAVRHRAASAGHRARATDGGGR
ncbi:acyl-ACP desaturase [Streptomyces sp. MMG1533]|uniref:acyl-ACP desaturase n=1 Tax=Streptomyces sp. MMG1533 TaxID=1415546 RepID=UPI0006AFFE6F|nr:acyl-ACP desaturase [Streptomyces sp. MMG1533]KOU59472.1 acyl-ACP desaturase [Streptomyces sp. MMG1533]